jgi:oligopeptide transport system permease protein
LLPGGPFDAERVPASPGRKHLKAMPSRRTVAETIRRYLGDLVRGDLGPSLKYRVPTVNDIIGQALPVSMLLGCVWV